MSRPSKMSLRNPNLRQRIPTTSSPPNYTRTTRTWQTTPTSQGRPLSARGIVLFLLLFLGIPATVRSSEAGHDPEEDLIRAREETARKWAPLVWLHSQEKFYPADVHDFLPNVFLSPHINNRDLEEIIPTSSLPVGTSMENIPTGPSSTTYFLNAPIYEDCKNCPLPDFLYGKKPSNRYSPPTYAVIHSCPSSAFLGSSFHRSQRHAQDEESHHNTNQPTESLGELSPYQLPKTFGTQDRTAPFPLQLNAKGLTSANSASVPTSLSFPTSVPPTSFSTSDAFFSATEVPEREITDPFSSDGSFTFSSLFSFFGKDNFENEGPSTHNIPKTDPSPATTIEARRLRVSSNHNKQNNLMGSTVLKISTGESNQYGSPLKTQQYNEAESPLPKINNSTTPTTSDEIYSSASPLDSSEMAQISPDGNESLSHKDNEGNHSSETVQILSNDTEPLLHQYNKDNYGTNTNPQFSMQNDQGLFLLKHQGAPYKLKPSKNDGKSSHYTSHRGHQFTVTYWMFYPYNHGKEICTLNLGFLGRTLKPRVKGICHGNEVTMGNHVGDWEHVSILFEDEDPLKMYVSAHNFGAFYHYESRAQVFHYVSQDTREGIPLYPNFPPEVRLHQSHPVLFSAKGSHGLWATPGKHEYNGLPLLLDETDFGSPWNTWANLEVIDYKNHAAFNSPGRFWLKYEGRWGNPRHSCHALMLGQCEFHDGPTGIPRKRKNFPCKKYG